MKTAVLLSGCGVYDGAEIHESVFTLLALTQNQLDYICVAPDIAQNHVINHTNGEEMNDTRNVFVESARIARGEILSLSELNKDDISSLVIPGGFGAAKNLSNWAFEGADGCVLQEVKDLITYCVENKKPIVALMGLAFKPNIDDLRESPALLVADTLLADGKFNLLLVEPNLSEISKFDFI